VESSETPVLYRGRTVPKGKYESSSFSMPHLERETTISLNNKLFIFVTEKPLR